MGSIMMDTWSDRKQNKKAKIMTLLEVSCKDVMSKCEIKENDSK